MTREQLQEIRDWANAKIATGEEPPWAWYQYMKLRETLDAILDGMAATKPLGSPELELRSGAGLRLVASTDRRESARPHRAVRPVRLPT
jgi:hypothetical protein